METAREWLIWGCAMLFVAGLGSMPVLLIWVFIQSARRAKAQGSEASPPVGDGTAGAAAESSGSGR